MFIVVLIQISENVSFPGDLDGKESAYNSGDLCSVPGWRRSAGGRHGNPKQLGEKENK